MADRMFIDRNAQWAAPGPYQTQLPMDKEADFQRWRVENSTFDPDTMSVRTVPYDPSPQADYDMRGYYQAQQAGTVPAPSPNVNDGRMHFTDQFKTPYHESFSRDSMFALPNAPQWNSQDQLIDEHGGVVFDERAKARQRVKD